MFAELVRESLAQPSCVWGPCRGWGGGWGWGSVGGQAQELPGGPEEPGVAFQAGALGLRAGSAAPLPLSVGTGARTAPPPPAVAKGGPPHRPAADRLHHDLAAPLQPDHRTLLPRPALPAFASRDILETSGSCFRGTGPEGARSPFQMGPGLEKPSELVCPQSSQGTPAALAPNRDPCIKEAAPCTRPPLSFQSRGLHLCCVGTHPPR